ncbi:MAG: protein kinase [Myxococcales bacterium]|nr:protein kinase [Myxococcales bacterium]
MADVDTIARWLEWRYQDHGASVPETLRGSYGRVWIVENSTVEPRRVAYKSVDPSAPPDADEVALFEREVGLWMRLPAHRCVLPVLSLLLAPPDGAKTLVGPGDPALPLVAMPYMDGSLADWKGSERFNVSDRLWALAQLATGLGWLYAHGFEGHGDLKPDNVLFRDLHRVLPEEAHVRVPRWETRVADFGWSDIWRARAGEEYATKAWRPYLAPERFGGAVEPQASDVFAFGIIAVELLTGEHPAGQALKRIKKSASKAAKWASEGERHVAVASPLNELLTACLDPDPSERPRVDELVSQLCRVLRSEHGQDVQPLLDLWNEHARKGAVDLRQRRYTEQQLAVLSDAAMSDLIDALRVEVSVSPLPGSEAAVASWLTASKSLCWALRRRGRDGDVTEEGELGVSILRVVNRSFEVDLRRQLYWDHHRDAPIISDLEPWEVFKDFFDVGSEAAERAGLGGLREVVELQSQILDQVRAANPPERIIARLRGVPWEGDQ